MVGRYDYEELKRKALENETEENLNALGEWFQMYGGEHWNGECWTVDGKRDIQLYPLIKIRFDEDGEIIDGDAVGYTFSRREYDDWNEKQYA